MTPLQLHQHLLQVIMVQPLLPLHLLQVTMVQHLPQLLDSQLPSKTPLYRLVDSSLLPNLKLHELNQPKTVMDLPLLRQLMVDLNLVMDLKVVQLVLQHQTAILHRVQVTVFQFKFRAAMALVVLLHPQHTRDLTIHHPLARHNLLHQILIMVLHNLTKIIMGLLLAVLTFKLLFQSLILITHQQTHFLFHLLIHTDHHLLMLHLPQTLITHLLLPNPCLLPLTMVHPKLPLAMGLQPEEQVTLHLHQIHIVHQFNLFPQ